MPLARGFLSRRFGKSSGMFRGSESQFKFLFCFVSLSLKTFELVLNLSCACASSRRIPNIVRVFRRVPRKLSVPAYFTSDLLNGDEDELALPLLEIIEPLQHPFSELQKARRDALASSSLEHDKRHASSSPTFPKLTQPFSYLPITVNCSGQPLLSPESTPLPTASPLASIVLPLLLNLRAHISLHSTQTIDSNFVATKTINNSHEEAVLGKDMGSPTSTSTLVSIPLPTVSLQAPILSPFAMYPPLLTCFTSSQLECC